jgi:drug/metabolite transporter (DMT)-like permease
MATSPAPGISQERPGRRAILIGNAVSLVGAILFVVSAATMVALWVRLLFISINWLGLGLGLLTAPLAAAYPFVHWFAHDNFPGVIFVVWLIGVLGMTTTMAWASWGRYRALRPAQGRARGIIALVATDESE